MDEEKKKVLIEKLKKARELAAFRRVEEQEVKRQKKKDTFLERKRKGNEESEEHKKKKCKVDEEGSPNEGANLEKRTSNTDVSLDNNGINESDLQAVMGSNKSKDIGKKSDSQKDKKNYLKIKIQSADASKSLTKKSKKSTSTERSRKCRAKMTEAQIEQKRAKDRERYRKKKEANLVKPIMDMSRREQRIQRKQWRVAQRNRRQKLKLIKNIIEETPPNSDNEIQTPSQSNRGSAGRKKMKTYRTKLYKDLQKAKIEIQKLKSEKEKFKKRYQRVKNIKQSVSSPSPRTKVNNLLKKRLIPKDIKKQLLIGEAFKAQVAENIKQLQGTSKEQQCYKKVLSGKILKKYRLQGELKKIVSYKQNKKWQSNKKILLFERKARKNILSNKVKSQITTFFEQDDVSRMCPGKKEFKRKGCLRKQKRLLILTLKDAYKKYMQDTSTKMSYPTFCKAKPFWVVPPTKSDRETCLCLKHENFHLLLKKINALKMLRETNVSDILKEDRLEVNVTNPLEEIEFRQWQSRNQERMINGTKKVLRITSKNIVKSTKVDLANEFFKQLPPFKEHVRNITHQHIELRNKKITISHNELLLQVDFSENYCTKLHSEIQSMHFGASKKQLSIHTGVLYYKIDNALKTESFATVSENLDHQCHGVWGHLTPILQEFANRNPQIDTVHFFSDGPTSQYKNRFNIFLLVTLLPEIFPTLKFTTWNYSEAGHGKGPMDGVGGTLKRQADNFVLRGGDIVSASDFVMLFIDSKIKVVQINSKTINEIKELRLPRNVKKIPNITKLHQIAWKRNTKYLYLRELSCFTCLQVCSHFSVGNGIVNFQIAEKEECSFSENSITPGDWVAVIYSDKWYPGRLYIIFHKYLIIF